MSKNNVDLHIDWASYKAAQYACENWHYSKSISVGKTAKIGVWENNKYIGAVIFSYGANPNLHKFFNLQPSEVVELTRVALKAHKTEVTKIIKITIKLLKSKYKKLRLIVSFADQNQGHYGGIYQGGNWIYSGIAKSTPQYFVKGKWIHKRQLGSLGYKSKDCNFPKRGRLDKFRYLMPLDKEMRKRVEKLSEPYPKRASVV